ncbi:MAG: substrate-binding domain-containing protein [Alphaproteobacteria bacterium]|nr:substrate-binding domain-containing protein [Alphaproteobacteria bacterium]
MALPASAENLDQIKAEANAATAPVTQWDGPTTGPKADKGKFIIYLADTQTNAGSAGTADGAKEAAAALGWKFQLMDGQNTPTGESEIFEQAIALKPDGIIVGSFNATAFKDLFKRAGEANIKIVTWHGAAGPGPIDGIPEVFWNLSTDPYQIANVAAKYAVAHSDGLAKAVILTDMQYPIVVTKTHGQEDGIKACETCEVLSLENAPYTEISQRMPSLMSALLQRYGDKLSYMLAFNDLYFDFSVPTLRANGVPQDGKPYLISAGDGSVSAYERIRKGEYQIATVPEPLHLHGWQAIDELNRAFHGEKASGYVTKVHLVTKENIDADGGDKNSFDPGNGYRDHYKKIWGVE